MIIASHDHFIRDLCEIFMPKFVYVFYTKCVRESPEFSVKFAWNKNVCEIYSNSKATRQWALMIFVHIYVKGHCYQHTVRKFQINLVHKCGRLLYTMNER